jgi:hypothetical protein
MKNHFPNQRTTFGVHRLEICATPLPATLVRESAVLHAPTLHAPTLHAPTLSRSCEQPVNNFQQFGFDSTLRLSIIFPHAEKSTADRSPVLAQLAHDR